MESPLNTITAAKYEVYEKLRDGRPVTIRAMHPDDKQRLLEAFRGLEESTIRSRFFGPKKEVTDQELISATEIDFVHNVALVACIEEATAERIIAVGRYVTLDRDDMATTAEVAFVVEEDFQRQGLASTLFNHLAAMARTQGISRFEAEVLPANRAMLKVFERCGLPVETEVSCDAVHLTIRIH